MNTTDTNPRPPHTDPDRRIVDRSIYLAWPVGEPTDDGKQPEAELSVHYFNDSGHIARLKQRVKRRGAWGIEYDYPNESSNHGLIVHNADASRFSATTIDRFCDAALAELRRRYDLADPEVVPYFDPASPLHAVG